MDGLLEILQEVWDSLDEVNSLWAETLGVLWDLVISHQQGYWHLGWRMWRIEEAVDRGKSEEEGTEHSEEEVLQRMHRSVRVRY